MSGPVITVDVRKIEENTRSIVAFCRDAGIDVLGVTKVTCGMPSVARAMIAGGVKGIGESRIENINRLKASGITAPMTLLRIPPLSAAREVVASVDRSLNSELTVIQELSLAAQKMGKIHEIILMVDLGDLREGILPENLVQTALRVLDLPGIQIAGIGTNLTCYGGVLPSEKNMRQLADYGKMVEDALQISLSVVSGGNSSALDLVSRGKMPKEITQLRIGEAIILGRETAYGRLWPGTSADAFILKAELIEVKEKPSVPTGQTGMDAFGKKRTFTDKGKMIRGILNVGREDVSVDGLTPVLPEVPILGASSDHLLLDITGAKESLSVGNEILFTLNYGALLAGMTSPYVVKEAVLPGKIKQVRNIVLMGKSAVFDDTACTSELESLGYTVNGPEPMEEERMVRVFERGAIPFIAGTERVTLSGMRALSLAAGQSGFIILDSHPSMMTAADAPPGRKILSTALGLVDKNINLSKDFSPENVVLIGVREALREESEMIRRLKIRAFTMEDIDLLGIREVMRRSLRTAGSGTRGIYVSFCQDVIDNSSESLTSRELHLAMELIYRSGLMRAIDISGCTQKGQTDFTPLLHFVKSVFGKRILMV